MQQYPGFAVSTTDLLYNKSTMKTANASEFHTGVPFEPVDLRIREEFMVER